MSTVCARAAVCSSTNAAQHSAQPNAKPAAPRVLKQLGSGVGAGVLSLGAAAGAAQAARMPVATVADLSDLPAVSLPAVDASGVTSLLAGADPTLLAAGVAVVAVPAALVALLGKGGDKAPKAKAVPAAVALEALGADDACVLLDIRSKAEVRATGAPNLKGVSRRGATAVPYVIVVKGEDVVDEEFVAKVLKVKGVAPDTPVILLDSDGSVSPQAAKEILAESPLEKLYYVQGGADAWQAAGAPWKEPAKGFTLDALSDGAQTLAAGVTRVAEAAAEAPDAAKGALVFAGIVGASAVLFTQLELLFELAGILAAGQFLLKVAFAEDREKTLTEIKKVVQEVDIPDLPQDLSKITSALLEDPTASGTQIKRAEAAAAAAVAAAAKVEAPTPAPAPELAPITPPASGAAAEAAAAPAATPAAVEVSATADKSA